MTLAGRLSAFFLTMLAVVLVAFSATLYWLASTHVWLEVDNRLESALVTLIASCEINDEGVEWEPNERVLDLGVKNDPDEVRWVARDNTGKLVDKSQNLSSDDSFIKEVFSLENRAPETFEEGGKHWRVATRRLQSDLRVIQPGMYRALALTARVSMEPTLAILQKLRTTLVALSLATWLFVAFLGRRLIRKGLEPLVDMSKSVQEMGMENFFERVPVPSTNDEVESLGNSFNGLLDRVQDAFERLVRFSGDASHQLRTPLTSMIGQMEVALRRERTDVDYRQALFASLRQARRLSRIVESLLFLARPEAEAGIPDTEKVDVESWLADHVSRWADSPRVRDLRSELIGDKSSTVDVNPALLDQLIDNLVDNAFKYSEPGSPVTLTIEGKRDVVEISVSDRGEGIPPADVEKVFEPFFRTDRARKSGKKGVGLGLSVARRIARAHGGELTAKSLPGGGTRFLLSLPRAIADRRSIAGAG